MYPLITLETYPPMFLHGDENPFYDEEVLEFTVPLHWLYEEYKINNFGDSDFDTFLLEEYTWDDTLFLYERAKTENVIVKERITKR